MRDAVVEAWPRRQDCPHIASRRLGIECRYAACGLLESNRHDAPVVATLFGKLNTVLLARPVQEILLAIGICYWWIYCRYANKPSKVAASGESEQGILNA